MDSPALRTFVTGFAAFGRFTVNPAALLAQSLGRRFEVLEVAFAAVDDFVERLAADDSFDRLLMIGVAGDREIIKLERLATNTIGEGADVRGMVRGPGPIEPAAPQVLISTLFEPPPQIPLATSDDAGCYLCNYAYYRALRRLPHRRIGFVHVPPLEAMSMEAQRSAMTRLIEAIEFDQPPLAPRSR